MKDKEETLNALLADVLPAGEDSLTTKAFREAVLDMPFEIYQGPGDRVPVLSAYLSEGRMVIDVDTESARPIRALVEAKRALDVGDSTFYRSDRQDD